VYLRELADHDEFFGLAASRNGARPFDVAQDSPFDVAQDRPFDVAQDRPFDLAQDRPSDLAQDRPFDAAQDRRGARVTTQKSIRDASTA